jgi:hypothetical protein
MVETFFCVYLQQTKNNTKSHEEIVLIPYITY